jgi:hypothetical protein
VKSFKIVAFFSGPKTNFYTIKFDNEELSEAEKFFKKFRTEYPDDIQLIARNISRVAEKRGAFADEFRPEGRSAHALPLGASNLRLYILRVSTKTVIIGNGGFKHPIKTRVYQQDAILHNCVKLIEKLDRILSEKFEESSNDDIDNFIINFRYTEEDGDE